MLCKWWPSSYYKTRIFTSPYSLSLFIFHPTVCFFFYKIAFSMSLCPFHLFFLFLLVHLCVYASVHKTVIFTTRNHDRIVYVCVCVRNVWMNCSVAIEKKSLYISLSLSLRIHIWDWEEMLRELLMSACHKQNATEIEMKLIITIF